MTLYEWFFIHTYLLANRIFILEGFCVLLIGVWWQRLCCSTLSLIGIHFWAAWIRSFTQCQIVGRKAFVTSCNPSATYSIIHCSLCTWIVTVRHGSLFMSDCLSVFVCLSVSLSVCVQFVCLSVHPFLCLLVSLLVCPFMHLSVFLSVLLFVYLTVCLSILLYRHHFCTSILLFVRLSAS